MKTIMLRFSNNFAPKEGTIAAHEKVIKEKGFVWFGKLGNKVSSKITTALLEKGPNQILLVQSGSTNRYWAKIDEVSYTKQKEHPEYYGKDADFMQTWFKITEIKKAPDDITDFCILPSSGNPLTSILKKTMGSYLIIDVDSNKI